MHITISLTKVGVKNMAKFENVDGITSITMDGIRVGCFCPIGKSMCTYNVTVRLKPNKWIPDYIEVEAMIKLLEGKTHTLESACAKICNDINGYIEPKKISVTIICKDARHMPAKVEKTINNKKRRQIHEKN